MQPSLQQLQTHEPEHLCETCREPLYAVAGSEDEEGFFQHYTCLNEHCPKYLDRWTN